MQGGEAEHPAHSLSEQGVKPLSGQGRIPPLALLALAQTTAVSSSLADTVHVCCL